MVKESKSTKGKYKQRNSVLTQEQAFSIVRETIDIETDDEDNENNFSGDDDTKEGYFNSQKKFNDALGSNKPIDVDKINNEIVNVSDKSIKYESQFTSRHFSSQMREEQEMGIKRKQLAMQIYDDDQIEKEIQKLYDALVKEKAKVLALRSLNQDLTQKLDEFNKRGKELAELNKIKKNRVLKLESIIEDNEGTLRTVRNENGALRKRQNIRITEIQELQRKVARLENENTKFQVHQRPDHQTISGYVPVRNVEISRRWESTKYLHDEDMNKLRIIDAERGRSQMIVFFEDREEAFVKLEDICNILDNKMMTHATINAHAEILMDKYQTNENKWFQIFDSGIWTYVRMIGKKSDLYKDASLLHIEEKLGQSSLCSLLLFPISTNSIKSYMEPRNHWSLLMLNLEEPNWLLYNSGKKIGSQGNSYLRDAKIVKNYIEKFFRLGWRKAVIKKGNKEELKADTTQDHTFSIDKVACSLQATNSGDCGVYVCYAMEQIAKDEPIPETLTQDQLLRYKALLVQRFIGRYDL